MTLADGTVGTVDVSKLVTFTGVFELLREDAFFQKAAVNQDIGTVCWPNGADLDPDVLYSAVTGKPLPGGVKVAS